MTTPKSHGRRNSLAAYFHRTFVPEVLARSSGWTVRKYTNAVTKLCLYVAYDITLGEVNEAVIDRFHAWMLSSGIEVDAARQYRAYIRRIVRHARPGCCLKQTGRRPHEKESIGIDHDQANVEGSLVHFLAETYVPQRMVGCSPGSIEQITIAIRQLGRCLGHCPMVTDLTEKNVAGFLQWTLGQGLSRAAANNRRCSLLALWRYAYRQKLLPQMPDIPKLKEYRRLPEAWTEKQFQRLVIACASTKGMVGQVRAADFWLALILVIYDSGIRHRAAMLIKREHMDLSTGWLVVPAENQKQKVEQRFMLPEQTIGAIRKIWLPSRKLLFWWPGHSRRVWVHFHKIVTRAGLPNGRRDKFHRIRRTTATQIARVAGIDAAARQLGHSGINMTRRYIDPTGANADHDATAMLPRPELPGNGEGGASL